ncbi:MAG: hypothetical protein ABJA83_02025 [Burkholderiaceae bacterium]
MLVDADLAPARVPDALPEVFDADFAPLATDLDAFDDVELAREGCEPLRLCDELPP